MSATEFTFNEKRRLHRDGFIVIRDAVPRELTFRARRAVNMHAAREGVHRPYHDLSAQSPLPDLVNKSRLGEIMRNTMGPYDPPRSAFAATLHPQPDTGLPNYGWQPHVDGMWYSPDIPKTSADVDSWETPRTPHFGSADATEMGANKTPFFQDPACTLSLGSFTAFVGVALNDQTRFGRGNLCLLKGAHEEVEAFFPQAAGRRWQGGSRRTGLAAADAAQGRRRRADAHASTRARQVRGGCPCHRARHLAGANANPARRRRCRDRSARLSPRRQHQQRRRSAHERLLPAAAQTTQRHYRDGRQRPPRPRLGG